MCKKIAAEGVHNECPVQENRTIRRKSDCSSSTQNIQTKHVRNYVIPFARNHKNLSMRQLSILIELRKKSTLPKLPVPNLESTIARYLRSVKIFLTNDELKETERLSKEFVNGVGKELQELVEMRAESCDNWLSDWWLDSAYMSYRSPVVIYSSPGVVFPVQDVLSIQDQLNVAAKVIAAAVAFKDIIDSKSLPPDMLGNIMLDMSQYYKIFGTCRIPGVERDTLVYHRKSKHIVIICNNHFFKLDVYTNDIPLTALDIIEQLYVIVQKSLIPAEPVGILSSENRNQWGKIYQQLNNDNATTMKAIEESLFIICIDKANFSTNNTDIRSISSVQMIHGGGSRINSGNRWFDKTVQFIIGTNGELGLTFEHSPTEGTPIAGLMDYIVKYMKNETIEETNNFEVSKVQELEFYINSEVECAIEQAKCNLDILVDDLDMCGFTFNHFGKDFIKSQHLSPDSFIQIAIQSAYYKVHNKPGAHYESASTRKFIHGRTETIRSCSNESVAFAKAMTSNESQQVQLKLMKEAIKYHKECANEAVTGSGIDRHLLGLKLAAIGDGEIPPFFKDKGFLHSSHFCLSTSQVPCVSDAFMCYGPLVPDGYGCCYNPRTNSINFGLSAFRSCSATSTVNFKYALESTLTYMHDLLLFNSY